MQTYHPQRSSADLQSEFCVIIRLYNSFDILCFISELYMTSDETEQTMIVQLHSFRNVKKWKKKKKGLISFGSMC